MKVNHDVMLRIAAEIDLAILFIWLLLLLYKLYLKFIK
jgi:hypothetical protein